MIRRVVTGDMLVHEETWEQPFWLPYRHRDGGRLRGAIRVPYNAPLTCPECRR